MLTVHSESACDICFESFNGDENTPDRVPCVITICGHIFCRGCLNQVQHCPMCRRKFPRVLVTRLHVNSPPKDFEKEITGQVLGSWNNENREETRVILERAKGFADRTPDATNLRQLIPIYTAVQHLKEQLKDDDNEKKRLNEIILRLQGLRHNEREEDKLKENIYKMRVEQLELMNAQSQVQVQDLQVKLAHSEHSLRQDADLNKAKQASYVNTLEDLENKLSQSLSETKLLREEATRAESIRIATGASYTFRVGELTNSLSQSASEVLSYVVVNEELQNELSLSRFETHILRDEVDRLKDSARVTANEMKAKESKYRVMLELLMKKLSQTKFESDLAVDELLRLDALETRWRGRTVARLIVTLLSQFGLFPTLKRPRTDSGITLLDILETYFPDKFFLSAFIASCLAWIWVIVQYYCYYYRS